MCVSPFALQTSMVVDKVCPVVDVMSAWLTNNNPGAFG